MIEPNVQEMKMFSEGLSSSIEKLYRVGGLALVFTFLGFATMFVGHLIQSALSTEIFTVGAIVSLVCLSVFVIIQVRGPMRARKVLKENEELLNNIQVITLRLTRTIGDLQSLMFKHTEQISRLIELAAPLLAEVPVLSSVAVAEAGNINAMIVDATRKSQEVIQNVEQALQNGDASNLKRYALDLEKIGDSLNDALKKQSAMVQIPDYKGQLEALQQSLIGAVQVLHTHQILAVQFIAKVEIMLARAVALEEKLPFGKQALAGLNLAELVSLSQAIQKVIVESQPTTDELLQALAENNVERVVPLLKQLVASTAELKQLPILLPAPVE